MGRQKKNISPKETRRQTPGEGREKKENDKSLRERTVKKKGDRRTGQARYFGKRFEGWTAKLKQQKQKGTN